MLDPVRADRVRRMVPDEDTWPAPVLRMKRIRGGSIVEFGTIMARRHERQPAPGLTVYTTDGPAYVYADVEDLIKAGWAVD